MKYIERYRQHNYEIAQSIKFISEMNSELLSPSQFRENSLIACAISWERNPLTSHVNEVLEQSHQTTFYWIMVARAEDHLLTLQLLSYTAQKKRPSKKLEVQNSVELCVANSSARMFFLTSQLYFPPVRAI